MRIKRRSFHVSVVARFLMVPAVLLGMLAAPQAALAAADCFVDANAAGNDDGSSWTHAYVDLQDALPNDACVEIWVADGVYTPGAAEGDTFLIEPGKAIYGGFAGGETLLSERDPQTNLAILSGDIGGDDVDGDADDIIESYNDIVDLNSDHVVTLDGIDTVVTASTVLDGFVITAGQADGGGLDDQGGGLYCDGQGADRVCSPTLNQLTFIGNSAASVGGAIYNDGQVDGTSNPTITNVSFINNHAGVAAGAVYNSGAAGTSSPTFEKVLFEGNHSGDTAGAMMNNAFNTGISSPTLTNVTFFGNVAVAGAGAIRNTASGGASSPALTNVTFAQNQAGDDGGAMFNHASNGGTSNPVLTNVIFWGNTAGDEGEQIYNGGGVPSINYSIVEGGDGGIDGVSGLTAWSAGTGNRDEDPALADLGENGGYTRTMALGWRSPAINTGDNGLCPVDDQRGRDRPQGPACDMGAYEFYPCFVDDSAVGANDGTSWEDAYTDLQDALGNGLCAATWVAGGVYTPGAAESDAFVITPGVVVYGGFAGTEGVVGERIPGLHVSVLSGDIDNNDTNKDASGAIPDNGDIVGDNTDNLVRLDGTGSPVTSSTVLDGFTITGGQADGGVFPFYVGGGLYCNGSNGGTCSPTLRNLTFSGNSATTNGGAVYLTGGTGGTSSPSLIGVTFRGNHAGGGVGGGAMHNSGVSGGVSSPTLINVTFYSNSATNSGGAMYNSGLSGTSNPVLQNVTFNSNMALTANGGAIYNQGTSGTSTPSLTNVILWGDTAATSGPEMYDLNANPSISYSIVSGGEAGILDAVNDPFTSGPGNLDVDPNLGNLADNTGWTPTMALMGPSGALDIGLGGGGCPGTDQRGILRPKGAGCDRGAYEKIPYVPSDFDGDGITDPAKFDSANNAWWLRSSDAAWDGEFLGAGTYVGRSDFDGDGKADPAKFDANSLWYVKSSNGTFTGQYIGPGTYTFVAGSDYEGDGKTDPAQFNTTVNSLWYYGSNDSAWHGIYLGPGTYQYVTGSDFDGDGMSDPAHFDSTSNVLWYMQSSDSTWYGVYTGPGTYSYVEASDFDGDGMTDPAQFTASTNTLWYVPSSGGGVVGVWMGGTPLSYVPAVDFDGDGMTDPAGFDSGAHLLWYLPSGGGGWQTIDMEAGTYSIVN